MPLEAAVVYFMIGTCCTELNNLTGALDAFNNAIKVDPDYAEVGECEPQEGGGGWLLVRRLITSNPN